MNTQPELPTAAAPLIEFTLIPKGTIIKPEAALTIQQAFAPYLEQFKELRAHTDEITDPKEAKVTRLKLRKIRTDTDKKHQELKAESLNYGRTLDTAKNLINGQIEPLEAKLEGIEKAEERRVAEILAARKKGHLEQLRPYLEPGMPEPFVDNITDEQFARMLENAKTLQQAKIELQQREERERLDRKRLAREEQERQQAELDRLREEALQTQERLRLEREEQEKLRLEQQRQHEAELERQRKEQADKDAAAAEKLRKEKAENEAKLKKEREANEAKLAAERRQREALEEQQRLATEAENRRLAAETCRQEEAADAAEKAAQAPDKVKLAAYSAALLAVQAPQVKTKKAQALIEIFTPRIVELITELQARTAKL